MEAEFKNNLLVVIGRTASAQIKYQFGLTLEAEMIYDQCPSLTARSLTTLVYGLGSYLRPSSSYDRYREPTSQESSEVATISGNIRQGVGARVRHTAYRFILAEAKSVRSSASKVAVLAAYDNATAHFRAQKVKQKEALANERAGFYLVEKQRNDEARAGTWNKPC